MIPTATYRLQLDPRDMNLRHAVGLMPYLARLGVSHLYLPPIFQAKPGSAHGYDVVDPTRVNDDLGGRPALDELLAALRESRLGVILDLVPNHMAIGHHNPWWVEALRHGPTAPHARHLDLFWEPDGTLILPLLGRPYAEALAEGELTVTLEGDRLFLAYWEARFPLDPATYPLLIDDPRVLDASERVAGLEGHARVEAGEMVDSLIQTLDRDEIAARLAALDPEQVHTVAEGQHYRLGWWELSRERLGHRRFFTVTDLVGVRQELDQVFADTHTLVAELATAEAIDGARIDHIDGLWDPQGYLERLRGLWKGFEPYLVTEKILGHDERMPEEWPVDGTTGYDYLDASTKLFCDPDGLAELASFYRRFTGMNRPFPELAREQKRFIVRERLGPEIARLGGELESLARIDRWARDIIPSDLARALTEVMVALPVYRTYLREGRASEEDRRHLERAFEEAEAVEPPLDPRAIRFLRDLLLPAAGPPTQAQERFVARLQQLTGTVTAKGLEDTTFYLYNLLVSLNEVGGHPHLIPDDPVAAYHRHNLETALRQPDTMTTTSTHDTKRSEDVRSRIGALTQMAGSWIDQVERWHERNRRYWRSGEAGSIPTRNQELFIYQTLAGSWPLDPRELEPYGRRISEHLVKAAREAKVHTEWLRPDLEHEEGLVGFATGLLTTPEFIDELTTLCEPAWRTGALDSLAQLALRLAAPGVPDIYQGCELWDLSLTDPDNRRPVDWWLRDRLLASLDEVDPRTLADRWENGRIKLHVTSRGLALRRERAELFREGEYLPLQVEGERADHVVAFARRHGEQWALAAVPRLVMGLTPDDRLWPAEGWESTHIVLPAGTPESWRRTFIEAVVSGGETLRISQLLGEFPVALLSGLSP